MHPEKLLEPAAGRASFRSIAYALYKPTKRFYLFFLSPPSERARRSFPRTDNDPLCLFTRPRQTFRFSFVYIPYIRVCIHTCILPAARARPFRAVRRGQHALVPSFRPPFTRVALPCCTPALHSHRYFAREFIVMPPRTFSLHRHYRKYVDRGIPFLGNGSCSPLCG